MLEKVFQDLVKFEGLSLKVYKCTSGKLTIGYGRNLEDNGISKKEAELMMIFDISRLIMELDRRVNFWKGEPVNVRIVILQMAFQLGIGGLLGFKRFLAALKERDYKLAKKEMLDSRWAKQTPNRVNELAKYLDTPTTEEDNVQWNKDIKLLREFTNTVSNMSILE